MLIQKFICKSIKKMFGNIAGADGKANPTIVYDYELGLPVDDTSLLTLDTVGLTAHLISTNPDLFEIGKEYSLVIQ